jgi:phage tail protein X
MSRFTKYITVEGDRWDNIAYRAYGNANEVEALIFANPSVPITDVLPSGLELLVPIKDEPEVQQSNLPPWKR